MGSSSVNDEKIRQYELALKKQREQQINYFKYLQEQDRRNMQRTKEEANRNFERVNEETKRINEQLQSYNYNRFNQYKSQEYGNDFYSY